MIELTIEVSASTATAKRRTGESAASSPLEFDDLRLKTIEVFVDRLTTSGEMKRKELETLGEHLYVGLLTGGVRSFVEEALVEASSADRVQVRLRLPDPRVATHSRDAELTNLPWEYLYCPGLRNGFFVSQRANLVLSRYMPLDRYPNETDVDEDMLRIGLVFANPHDDDLGPVAADDVIKDLRVLDRRTDVKVDLLEYPTPTRVLEWLKTFQPHVMHFIGHGGFDRGENSAKIVLLDEDGESRDVADYELGGYFDDAGHTPTVVLLHLPEGDSGDIEPNMARLAPALIRAGVPAVVAMQHPFPVIAARHFITAFYQSLADEDAIDIAVTRGRHAYLRMVSGASDDRAFGTPVLYARAWGQVVSHPVGSGQSEEPLPTPGPERKLRQPRRRKAATGGPSPVDLKSSVELGNGAGTEPNGTTPQRAQKPEGLVRAILIAGERRMAEAGLTGPEKATVYGWFRTLDEEFAGEASAEAVADFIRYTWLRPQQDARLRGVAETMERTARKDAR